MSGMHLAASEAVPVCMRDAGGHPFLLSYWQKQMRRPLFFVSPTARNGVRRGFLDEIT